MLCSADDKSGDTELTKLYKLSDAKEDTIDAKAYKIIKGAVHLFTKVDGKEEMVVRIYSPRPLSL